MKNHILALAALAAIGFSGAALAGEVKSSGPVQMTDEQMDQVTAGAGVALSFNNGNTLVNVQAGPTVGPGGTPGGFASVDTQKTPNNFGGGGANFQNAGPGGGAFTSTPAGTHCGGTVSC
jgi:hypothetical protein